MSDNVIHDEEDLRFYMPFKEEDAELTYTYPETEVMDFDHTYVPDSQRGKGIAGKLVKEGLEYARSRNYKVIPSCPVVEAYIKRNPEYKDMVQPE
ncbi:GNAT family N-acetyltransferase [Pontibacter actiniarum]|uniref:N-acetyltransferase n=1 Tax=Pontibacter actiniarum TaxID=323450 RepID=A0A1X9YRU0_9BACT|nr:GNAT family N-acetyltransferase [Pontibacter actiniarum]ARS35582.1 N-acetyltransferase [Pontibacter actiniarum]